MPVSFASVDVSKMELTPCRVTYNGADLGGAKDVKVSIAFEKSPIQADQYGSTIMDKRVSGLKMTVEMILLEVNSIDKWKAAVPNMQKVGSGPYAGYFTSRVGESDYGLSQSLVLHPLSKADADKSSDYNFYKVTADSVTEIGFSATAQQGLKCVFSVYPDTTTSPARFMMWGDPTIGIVNASAGAATFTGTGNGTITSIAAVNGSTLTETITVKVVGVPATNKSNWTVTGSVSGLIGYCQITSGTVGGTVSFSSSKCSFTLTSGSTAFVLDDNFVFSTTAANYV